MRWIRQKLPFLVLAVLVLASISIPPVREAHVLCFRLLFHLDGKTFVQGQPPGCLVYTLPNVQFSGGYRHELRQRSNRSPDNFALATAAGDWKKWGELKPPPAAAWTNHPLLEWGALTFARFCHQQQSPQDRANDETARLVNLASLSNARELIQLAQAVDSTNGALWLAEAMLNFDAQQDDAALVSLRAAAQKAFWRAGTETDSSYRAELFEEAGLSRLDSTIEANAYTSEHAALIVQVGISRQLLRLMREAVQTTNDQRFSELLAILVDLRKHDWADRGIENRNIFRRLRLDDDLIDALASRMGEQPLPLPNKFADRQKYRWRVFEDYLNRQPDQRIVSRFLGQMDAAETERSLRSFGDNILLQSQLSSMVRTNLSGAYGGLALLFLTVGLLLELPFAWLRRIGFAAGKWPNRPRFWICALLVMSLGVLFGTNFLFQMGLFSDVGLRFESYSMSPRAKALLASIALCCCWFGAALTVWKARKTPPKSSWVILLFAYAYVIAAFAMAYFRLQTTERLAPGFGFL